MNQTNKDKGEEFFQSHNSFIKKKQLSQVNQEDDEEREEGMSKTQPKKVEGSTTSGLVDPQKPSAKHTIYFGQTNMVTSFSRYLIEKQAGGTQQQGGDPERRRGGGAQEGNAAEELVSPCLS